MVLWTLVYSEISTDGREALTQFLPISSIPTVAKRTEPLIAMRLSNRCSRSDNLPAFAASVARSADLIQPARGWRQVFGLGQGALARSFTRAVDIKDGPGVALSIKEPSRLLVGGEWPSE